MGSKILGRENDGQYNRTDGFLMLPSCSQEDYGRHTFLAYQRTPGLTYGSRRLLLVGKVGRGLGNELGLSHPRSTHTISVLAQVTLKCFN